MTGILALAEFKGAAVEHRERKMDEFHESMELSAKAITLAKDFSTGFESSDI